MAIASRRDRILFILTKGKFLTVRGTDYDPFGSRKRCGPVDLLFRCVPSVGNANAPERPLRLTKRDVSIVAA